MRSFASRVAAILTAITLLAVLPNTARANGNDVHFGSVEIPVVAIYCIGGFAALVVLFFVANWVRYRRSQSGEDPTREPHGPTRDDEEEDNDR